MHLHPHLLEGSWAELGAYDIPGVRKFAALLGVTLRDPSSSGEIEALTKACGSELAFANSIRATGEGSAAEKLIWGFGLHHAQRLRTVFGQVSAMHTEEVRVLLLGATVQQMRLVVKHAHYQAHKFGIRHHRLLGLASAVRPCDSPAEAADIDVQWVQELLGDKPPTEFQMMRQLLRKADLSIAVVPSETELERTLHDYARQTAPTSVYLPSYAGGQCTVLMARRVLRSVWGSEFDADGSNCRLYFSCIPWMIASQGQPDNQADQPLYGVPGDLVKFMHELYLLEVSA